MNDGITVSMWQDVSMEQPTAEVDPQPIRTVDDVEVLKALADPTRIAILAALMKAGRDLPIMSVKELAAELGQPQTKLYRHVRQLEAAGLIKVAATRLVSGILEHRYQACQRDLTFGRGFLREHADQADVALQAVLERYRDGFLAAYRADRLPADGVPAEESYRKPVMFLADLRVSAAKAAQLRGRLQELIDGMKDDQVEDPEGVSINLLFGYYVADDPGDR
jgi:DNA-binding transcriptional ArsR family regulator